MNEKVLPDLVWYPMLVASLAAPTAIALAVGYVAGSTYVVPAVMFVEIALMYSWYRWWHGRRLVRRQAERGYTGRPTTWEPEQLAVDEGVRGTLVSLLVLMAMFVTVPIAIFALSAAIIWG